MHPLLARQLRKYYGVDDLAALPAGPLADFVTAVGAAYESADTDRVLAERSMEISSQELLERNQDMARKNEELEIAQEELRRSRNELECRVDQRTTDLREAKERAEAPGRAKPAFLGTRG